MTTGTLRQPVAEAATATGGDYLRQFAVIVVTLLTIAVNLMATRLPLNGLTTGDISDRFPTLFTPAGYVFAIWGVIYLGLLAYTVFQALPSQRTNPRLRRIGWLYVLSGLANSIWIFLWHYLQFGLSALVMLVLLASLTLIYTRIWPSRSQVSRGEWWTTNLAFSIYLGWISVATIANVSVLLTASGWNGGGIAPELWTVMMLLIAGVLGLFFGLRLGDAAYVLVLAWAFAGIYVKQGAAPMVAWTALALAVAMAAVAIVAMMRARSAARSV
jgi:hypothetical protein